jgi:Flp pilus assembly protein TadG
MSRRKQGSLRCGWDRSFRATLAVRFARDESGVAAIEFGVVAIPFLALMFAIIETAMVFFAGQTLETAVADSGRLIMTGQAQAQSFDQAKFKSDVCTRTAGLFDCSKMAVAVQKYADFNTAQQDADVSNPSSLVDSTGNFKPLPYNQGVSCDIILVRVMYQWPIYVSMLGLNSLADMTGGKRLLLATAAFRNEPFGAGSVC